MVACGVPSGEALSCTNDRDHSGVHSWVGLTHDPRHRYYVNGAGPLTSVTTALKVYDKSDALVGWAQRETAKSAITHHELVALHLAHTRRDPLCPLCVAAGIDWPGPAEAAVRWLKRMPGYQKDAAADMGSAVHRYAEQIGRGGLKEEVPDLAIPFVESYLRWRDTFQPIYRLIEFGVYHPEHGYGGTGDIVCIIDGESWMIDVKTGGDLNRTEPTGVYPEQGMQLAAYGKAPRVGYPGNPKLFKMPAIDRYGILQIRPERARFMEFTVTDRTFEAFLSVLDLYRWREGEGKSIVAGEITPGIVAPLIKPIGVLP